MATRGHAHTKIDKSVLAISEQRRIRCKEHLRYVARQPCLICGRSPSHAHHIRYAQSKDHFAVRDWPIGLNYLEPWFRPTIGIALHDGVGELDATAAFEVYGQSAAAHTIAMGTGDTVRTRHGLVLLTTPLTQAPDLSRVLVPGASETIDPRLHAWADHQHLAVESLTGRPGPDGPGGGGFTAALQNLADHTDASTTRTTAKMIGYPTTELTLGPAHRSWRAFLLGLASLAVAILLGRSPTYLSRRRTRRRQRPRSSVAPRPAPLSGVELRATGDSVQS